MHSFGRSHRVGKQAFDTGREESASYRLVLCSIPGFRSANVCAIDGRNSKLGKGTESKAPVCVSGALVGEDGRCDNSQV